MAEELLSMGRAIGGHLEKIAERGPLVVEAYRKRITDRVQSLVEGQGVAVEPEHLIREVAIFAERGDIAEEVVRLRAHLVQYAEVIGEPESAGRKLEFVVQEMGRETNTIGSKANDVEISRGVVEIKGAPGEDPRADPERGVTRPLPTEREAQNPPKPLGPPRARPPDRDLGRLRLGQEHARRPPAGLAPA